MNSTEKPTVSIFRAGVSYLCIIHSGPSENFQFIGF